MLADALDSDGITAAIIPDEEALKLPPDEAPRVVITSMNRTHNEDLTGLKLVPAMRRKWPDVCPIYPATLWPARLPRRALGAHERFLAKPVRLTAVIRAVRELLNSGLSRQPARAVISASVSRSSLPPSGCGRLSARSRVCCRWRTGFRITEPDGDHERALSGSSLRAAPMAANSNDAPPARRD